MVSIASRAISIALRMQRKVQGATDGITFTRGDDISIEMFDIQQGRTEWKGMAKGGLVVISESADFFIPADLLVWDGEILKPEKGDKLHVNTDTLATVYDVQPFGPDRLEWRWHDRTGRTIRRTFTKLLSEGPV